MSMARAPLNVSRQFKDVSKLTPYEQKIWELHQQGQDSKQIAEAIGTKHSSTITSRMHVIKEKLEVQDD